MPGVAAVVIASLGIGIGVNTTVFSWIQARTLQPLAGVPSGGSFYLVEPRTDSGIYPGASWLEFRDLRDRMPAFADLIAFRMAPFSVGDAAWSERTFGLLVSPNYFTALGVTPALGRFFSIDDAPIAGGAGEPVAVVSHAFWQARLGGGPDAIGRTLRVNNRTFTVVGIAQPDFRGTLMGVSFDLWIPATFAPAVQSGSRELETRGQRGYSLIGRLKPGVSTDVAQSELEAAMADFAREYPDISRSMRADVLPIWRAPRGPQRMLLGALAVLQGLMFIVLLTVCGNTANLLLGRASARRQEVAVRLALGGGRVRIVSLLLTESLVLAGAGTALGVALAVWGTDALRAVPMPTPAGVSFRFESAVDVVTVAFAAGLGLLSGVLFGLAPAWQLARLDAQPALRLGVSPAGRSRVRDALMFVEVALAIVVLIVAARFVRSFNETQSTDPGFRKDGVVLAAYDLATRARGIDPESSRAFAARLLARTRELPGVEAAALATSVPLDIHGMGTRFFTLEGRARDDGRPDQAVANTVSDGYFRTMGIALRAGTDFAGLGDTDAPPQAIVNESFTRRYLRGGEPVGRWVEAAGRRYTIVGVVADSLSNAFGEASTPALYFSFRDRPSAVAELHVRTRPGGEMDIAADVRRALRDIDPTLPLYNVRTLSQHVETNLIFQRIPARIFAVLGPLLLVLAAIGIYAVVSYGVAQRRAEVGLRMALGATAGRVVRQIVGETLKVVAAGAVAGWVLALGIDRQVASSVPFDIQAFAAVPLLLLVVAVGAATWPALRAGRVRPVVALKETGN
jgi:putative ABC transport system permease protein